MHKMTDEVLLGMLVSDYLKLNGDFSRITQIPDTVIGSRCTMSGKHPAVDLLSPEAESRRERKLIERHCMCHEIISRGEFSDIQGTSESLLINFRF